MMAPQALRARITAIYLLVLNLIGIGFGPLCIAALSDSVLGGKEHLGDAMAIISAVVVPLGAFILYRTLATFREMVVR
jgi:hypothetical protein